MSGNMWKWGGVEVMCCGSDEHIIIVYSTI